jgi:hypothetical protein
VGEAADMSFDEMLGEERTYFGDPLIMFLLGVESLEWIRVEQTPERANVLVRLRELRRRVNPFGWDGRRDLRSLIDALCSSGAPDEPSLACLMFISCGGQLPQVAGDDARSVLNRLALDIIPAVLAPRVDPHFPRLPLSLFRHSKQARFLQLASEGDTFFDGFGYSSEQWQDFGAAGPVIEVSDGSASSVQALGLLESIFNTALVAPDANGAYVARWIASVMVAFDRARGLMLGELTLTTLIGIRGPEIPRGATVELSEGIRIRPFTHLDLRFQPDQLAPSAVIEIDEAVTSARREIFEPFDFDRVSATAAPLFARRDSIIQAVQLAYLLHAGSNSGSMVVFRTTPIPGFSGSSASVSSYRFSPRPSNGALTVEDLSDFKHWFNAALTADSSLAVAGRRLVIASGERADIDDAFVDAVIAWESMLGASTEIAFRLSAAAARLLYTNVADARESSYRKFKKLYALRSKILHGSNEGVDSTIRDEAIDVGIAIFKAILLSPELAAVSSSDRRSELILLGRFDGHRDEDEALE